MLKTGIIWLFILIICVALFINIPSIIIPFFIAFILAYVLKPFMRVLQRKFYLSNSISALIVLSVFMIIFIYCMVILLPLVYSQLTILISKIPIYREYVNNIVIPFILKKLNSLDKKIADGAKEALKQSVDDIFAVFLTMLNNLWIYTIATLHAIVMLCLIPVLLFYFLRDWDNMKNSFYDLFPKTLQGFVRNIFTDINNILSSYIRGQLLVCVIWTIYYYISLSIIGVDLALILAVISGIAPIIPIIGTIIAVSIAMIVGFFTFGFSIDLLYIGIIYIIGNILDSAIVTPKIIGDSLGLNPIWIVFAVLSLGYMLGPIGMVIAIPIAGIISVILKYAKQDYKKSELYNLQIKK